MQNLLNFLGEGNRIDANQSLNGDLQIKLLRDIFCDGLTAAGMEFIRPEGAFYIYPRTPIEDDVAFVRELQKEHILAVPGSGFGRGGHIRFAFCVTLAEIEGALPGIKRVMETYR